MSQLPTPGWQEPDFAAHNPSGVQVDLVAVQASVSVSDYLTEAAFQQRIAELGAQIARQVTQPALVVFPEDVGAFLGLCGQEALVKECRTVDAAMQKVALSRLPDVLATMLRYKTASFKCGLMLTLAPTIHGIYYRTFSALAQRHGWYVVAGSALLPTNALGPDVAELIPADGRIYNMSYCFGPDGRCVGITRKVNLVPTQEDVLHLSPGPADEVALVETPFGRLGTTICYDGFCEPHTSREPRWTALAARLDAAGADLIACPSANPWPWEEPWVFNQAGEGLLRKEQWLAEGLYASMQRMRHTRFGINPMLIGTLLDAHFDGRSFIFERTDHGVKILAEANSPTEEQILVASATLHQG